MAGQFKASGRVNPTMTYIWLWPGLPQLWLGGRWTGLSLALGFAAALNGMLLTTLVWDELLPPPAAWSGWCGVVVCWVAGAGTSRKWLSQQRFPIDPSRAVAGDLFPEALNEYLQGNWYAAEAKCRELIGRRRDDVEARLLLATLLRHADRPAEAVKELDALAKFDGAAQWEHEIALERRLLAEAAEATAEDETSETGQNRAETRRETIRRAA